MQESIVKGGFVKIAKHLDDKWHVAVMNNNAVEMLYEMGVNIEEDMQKLNNDTF